MTETGADKQRAVERAQDSMVRYVVRRAAGGVAVILLLLMLGFCVARPL